MSLKFKRKIENFVCRNCGKKVDGNGYTNHCPHCLWSKHVDIFPGDRAEKCGGMMEPISIENKKGKWSIIHKCQKCTQKKKNKISKEDNKETIDSLLKN